MRSLNVNRVILAVMLAGTALGVTFLLQNVIPVAGYIFFYIAVIVSAWFGGLWAGLVTAILSVLAVGYYLVPPYHSFRIHSDYIPVFVEFVASSLIVGWFSSWRREAELELKDARDHLQIKVDERTAELSRTNKSLVAEIAERKRAETASLEARAELARITRISAMGALAASISHEVNQPLAAVVTNADACAIWLTAEPPNVSEARAAVDCIAREGTRASDIIRRIRSLFAKSAPERGPVPVNDLIRGAAALLQAEISRNGVALETELDPNLPSFSADSIQLQQVIANLIMNAVEAMSKVDRPRRLLVRSEVRDQEIGVVFKDSGIGIDPENQKRIFDPFFTTKSSGMGMGLAISQSIIEAHGGRLWATANNGAGATLQFTLPIAL
jgi:C4-dicarboxylate-specific signal transduction histidine kinase